MKQVAGGRLSALARSLERPHLPRAFQLPQRAKHSSGWRVGATLMRVVSLASNVLVFVALSLGGGLFTAWQLIDNGTALTTLRVGPWTSWIAAGQPNPDPYTRAHQSKLARMPEPGGTTRIFHARTDNEGTVLRTSCEYVIAGRDPVAGWWSLALFDQEGRLIRNPANRYAFNRDNVLRNPDGSYRIVLARQSRSGNWLPTGTATSLNLVMTLTSAPLASSARVNRAAEFAMPEIRRSRCR